MLPWSALLMPNLGQNTDGLKITQQSEQMMRGLITLLGVPSKFQFEV